MLENDIGLSEAPDTDYIFHVPCHDPMKHYDSLKVASTLLRKEVVNSDRRCGESGTFAVSRPDIAQQVRYRKLASLDASIEVIQSGPHSIGATEPEIKILTSCPSCKQGLARYRNDTELDADYLVVEIMLQTLGENWQEEALQRFANNGIKRVLL